MKNAIEIYKGYELSSQTFGSFRSGYYTDFYCDELGLVATSINVLKNKIDNNLS